MWDTTAAYNPRTNGLTERFNQTLCESLRKHAEANPLDWVKWFPYVLMCYRRRVHSITGYSPFQLMFGCQMKHFGDWRVQEAEDEVLALRARAEEIKKLQSKNIIQLNKSHKTANIVSMILFNKPGQLFI